jgi:transposase
VGIKLKYPVELQDQEKIQLQEMIHTGVASTRVITRARILLSASEGKTDKEIYEGLDLGVTTPYDIRKKYHEGGLQNALYEGQRPGQKRKLNGEQEAEVVAIACTKAPKGYARWTLDLLTVKVQKQLQVDIKRSAIWHVLLRNHQKPWREKNVVHTKDYAGVYQADV